MFILWLNYVLLTEPDCVYATVTVELLPIYSTNTTTIDECLCKKNINGICRLEKYCVVVFQRTLCALPKGDSGGGGLLRDNVRRLMCRNVRALLLLMPV